MSTCAVVGMQWGDEGKGKLVTSLAPKYRYVVRYQGGGNAGHTVYVDGKKIVLHHLPSGAVCPQTQCLLMPGMVLDPETFLREVESVRALGIPVEGRIRVSERLHITTDYQRQLDRLREGKAGMLKIGTTGRGIGLAYSDKAQRFGIRAIDLLDREALTTFLSASLAMKNPLFESLGAPTFDVGQQLEALLALGEKLRPYLADTSIELAQALRRGDGVLFEGAQAAMLDLDLGTYPYVTSSCTMPGGISGGTGVNVGKVGEIIGVVKAYCTRVGDGGFPTELSGPEADHMRTVGGEFGSTTGRPRRCGWFDAHAVRTMALLGNVSCLCMTKLDVLAGLKTLRIGAGYQDWSSDGLPASATRFAALQPVYETLEGFDGDLGKANSWSDLPVAAQRFVGRVEELVGVPIRYLSTGPHTHQLIVRNGC